MQVSSKRLILQPVCTSYIQQIFQEFTPKITTFMYPKPPQDIQETEAFVQESIQKFQAGEEFVAVILQKDTKEFLGIVGAHKIDTQTPELGIWIKESAHGNGYGKEAVFAMKDWIDANVTYQYIAYPVDQENLASRRIPDALGAKVAKKYDKLALTGRVLKTHEYRIYPKHNYDAIIFDIDGTLWDANTTCAKAWRSVLKAKGEDLIITKDDIGAVTGKPFDECVRTVLPELCKKYPDLITELNQAEQVAIAKHGGQLYQGVPDAIIALSKKYKIFLLSNCQEQYLYDFIQFSGLKDVLTGYDCNGIAKAPKEQMLQAMITKYNLQNPVYVGDTELDYKACQKAQVPFLYAAYGFGQVNNPKVLSFECLQGIASYLAA